MFFSLVHLNKGEKNPTKHRKDYNMDDGINRTSISDNLSETLAAAQPSTVSGNLPDATPALAMQFDPAEFCEYLADTDWTDDQKAEYIRLIWDIVCEFVALGFDVHPLQQAQNSSGKDCAGHNAVTAESGKLVQSSHKEVIEEFVNACADEMDAGEKESPE